MLISSFYAQCLICAVEFIRSLSLFLHYIVFTALTHLPLIDTVKLRIKLNIKLNKQRLVDDPINFKHFTYKTSMSLFFLTQN